MSECHDAFVPGNAFEGKSTVSPCGLDRSLLHLRQAMWITSGKRVISLVLARLGLLPLSHASSPLDYTLGLGGWHLERFGTELAILRADIDEPNNQGQSIQREFVIASCQN